MWRLVFLVLAVCLSLGGRVQAETLSEAIDREARWSASVRAGVQNALMWTGDYQSRLDGEFGPMTRRAIEAFQRRKGFAATGYLTGRQIELLEAERKEIVDAFGYSIREFPELGLRIGLPGNLIGIPEVIERGLRFPGVSSEFNVVIDLISMPQISPRSFSAFHAEYGRDLDFRPGAYYSYKPDWFVFSGDTYDGFHLYTYVVNDADGLRGFSLFYHSEMSWLFGRLSTAMFNSLDAIPRLGAPPKDASPPTAARTAPDPRPATAPPPDSEPESGPSSGTGFVIGADGHALTNHHVVAGCARLRVNGRYGASIVVSDANYDLAVLRIAPDFPIVEVLAFRAASAELNEDITILGFPLKGLLESINVTRGSVSSLTGLGGDFRVFQITAPVQPGNSGGPVIDAGGLVIGIVQSKLDAIAVIGLTGDIPQNINFAISGTIAQLFLSAHSIPFETRGAEAPRSPTDLARSAREATILVECLME